MAEARQKTVLITIGRLPKALDFARAFSMAGWRVIVAEPFKSHLTGVSKHVEKSLVTPAPRDGKEAYLQALLAIISSHHVDLVLPLSEETMHVAHLAGRLPASVRLYAPPPSRLLELHDKQRFIALAKSLGLSAPETTLLGSDTAASLAANDDYVLKPIFSCSGTGVSLHGRGDALPPPNPLAPAIVQQKISGKHFSTFALADAGRLMVNITYRGTIMTGTVAVAFERVEHPEIDRWVTHFVSATHHSGFISFDFIEGHKGEVFAIECNPRVTSGVHFITESSLAAAILSPASAKIELKPIRTMQQFYPALTEVQASIFRPRDFIRNFGYLATSKEVTWRADDPMPFISMPITAFGIIAMAMAQQKTFGQVSTDDIVWFEDSALDIG